MKLSFEYWWFLYNFFSYCGSLYLTNLQVVCLLRPLKTVFQKMTLFVSYVILRLFNFYSCFLRFPRFFWTGAVLFGRTPMLKVETLILNSRKFAENSLRFSWHFFTVCKILASSIRVKTNQNNITARRKKVNEKK